MSKVVYNSRPAWQPVRRRWVTIDMWAKHSFLYHLYWKSIPTADLGTWYVKTEWTPWLLLKVWTTSTSLEPTRKFHIHENFFACICNLGKRPFVGRRRLQQKPLHWWRIGFLAFVENIWAQGLLTFPSPCNYSGSPLLPKPSSQLTILTFSE